jgi:LptD protein
LLNFKKHSYKKTFINVLAVIKFFSQLKKSKMTAKIRLFLIYCLIFPWTLFAQRPLPESTARRGAAAPTSAVDTLGSDSLKVSIDKTTLNVSKDALDEPVDYEAKDSIIFDNAHNLVHLYGDASVKYQTIEVKAAYIVLDVKDNIATAEAKKDSLGRITGVPDFKDKEQNFKAQKMRYNFKKKKGIVFDVQTKQESLYVLGEKTKYVSAKDTTEHDLIYTKNAILTTCSDPHPHFGIRAQKLKVIANKMVIVGPSNLEIGGVPTPLWLPFGFYPVSKTKQTGFIFPSYYGYRNTLGFGAEGVGWYFPINQHFDLRVTGKYFTQGSWGVSGQLNYNYRYKYNGNFGLTFDNLASESASDFRKRNYQRPVSITWSHTQAQAARPNQSFSANLNIQTNASALQKNVQNTVRDVSSNTNSSGLSYRRSFPDRPYSFSTGINHSQNIRTHAFNLTPSIDFSINTLYPLRKLKRQGKDDALNTILENFNIAPTAYARSSLNTYDTLLFNKKSFENRLSAGLHYGVSASVPFQLFKVLTVSPNVSFNQDVQLSSIKKNYNNTPVKGWVYIYDANGKKQDSTLQTIYLGKIDTIKTWGMKPVSSFSMGVNANTSVFGTTQFRKGYFRGIRHKMDLSVGFQYSPNLTKSSWTDKVEIPRTPKTINDPIKYQEYSIFEGSVLGAANYSPLNKGTKILGINTTHNLEIKVKGKKDSIARKITLLRSFGIGTSINLNADSLEMSTFSPSFNQSIFNGLVNLQLRTTFSPYVQRPTGGNRWTDSKVYLWDSASIYEKGNFRIPKPIEFQGGNFSVSSGLSVADIKGMIEKNKGKTVLDTSKLSLKNKKQDTGLFNSDAPKDPFRNISSLIDNFRISHNLVFDINRNTKDNRDTVYIQTNSITVSGSLPLSNGWSIDFGSLGYDFKVKQLPYSSIGISRDLHCWTLGGTWFPNRGTFLFTLQVRNAPLDFLKIPVTKQNEYKF